MVAFRAYLIFKYVIPADHSGEVMTPEVMVAEAQAVMTQNGFKSL